jgi:hypothetical protein
MMNIQVGKCYQNIKTKNVYAILGIGLAAWDSSQCLIVYQRADSDDKTVWIRSRTEFNEKFKEVSPNDKI